MAKKSKLLHALDAHKGRDYEAEKKTKQIKAAEKRKRQKTDATDIQVSEDNEDDEDESKRLKLKSKKTKLEDKSAKLQPSIVNRVSSPEAESESESDLEAGEDGTVIPQPDEMVDASASEAEQEAEVPFSDLEDEDTEDVIPHQRLTINNGPALIASRKRVTVAKPKMPFHYHNSLVSSLPASETVISDPNDDLTRELEFYRIARDGVVAARAALKKEKIPFTRPSDYFAEMVKSDEHMGKVKKKLYDAAANKKASEEARKLRDAKKFGKAVQIAKEQERAKEKRATLDNIKELKKRRKGQASTNTTEADDLFQEISVENNNGSSSRKRDHSSISAGGTGPGSNNFKRQKRDSKFGFGGKKRFSKSGDAMSSSDLSGFSSRGMKGKTGGSHSGGAGKKRPTTKRLGKSKRSATR